VRVALVVLIVFVTLALIKLIRGARHLELDDVLPFLGDRPFGAADVVALVMLAIAALALRRLVWRREEEDE
jgi:hypothetical protein